jgi:hypothetical protein
VYSSGNGLNWIKDSGLEHASAVRDITSDPDGNIYISTNLGVYVLSIGQNTSDYKIWESFGYIDPETSDTFGICYSDTDDTILVGAEEDVLKWNKTTGLWESYSGLNIGEDVVAFEKSNDYIYALTDRCVYRNNPGGVSFNKIAVIGCSKARKISIFGSEILLSTDLGLLISDGDIYTDILITFEDPPVSVIKTGFAAPKNITCLNVQDGVLYIGTEGEMSVAETWYN